MRRTVWSLTMVACGVLLTAWGAAQGIKPLYLEATVTSFADLRYPLLALRTRVQGVVVVRIEIDEKGVVTDAVAISGAPPLLPDTLANARQWTFEGGPKTAVLVYDFRIAPGTCQDDSRSLFQLIHRNFVSITACTPVIVG